MIRQLTTTTKVPPIIIRMLQFRDICKKYDLSSVRFVYSGAAPLGQETIRKLLDYYPNWSVAQAYGKLFIPSYSSSQAA
jgi:acyl-coenzyme A synthetase/AMP-(fatty) acid ligase